MTIRKVGLYCRDYRMNVLKLTLEEVANGTNIKTLSGFEHGRSTNVLHVIKYIDSCFNRQYVIEFLEGLCEIMEGSNNE